MDDLISRQDAIDALMNDVTPYGLMDNDGNIEAGCKDKDVIAMLYNLPSVQPDASFVTWLLDEIWDEDLWELNCRSFPEVLCRRLVRYGYLKVEDGKYVRLDKQTGSD